MIKPKFKIYMADGDPDPLDAFQVLRVLDVTLGNHLNNDLRPPLGIYNTSLSRLSGRLEKCSTKLEELFRTSKHVTEVNANKRLLEEVLDCIPSAQVGQIAHHC